MSKEVIDGLEPKLMWEYFYGISQVPRPSKKEEKIIEHVRNFAKENNFEMEEDTVGNIVIKIPATKGHENKPIIVLQGHVDMVCEKNKGTEHDFDNDPIELIKDGDWMRANGTTLGADNGIGVAAAMAAATDPGAVHGPLEILSTIDEETGMTGVNALTSEFVEGRILLNMDSEEDGAFYVGCSGGQDTVGYYKIKTVENKKGFVPYELMITGLKGGHSGLDIQNGRANAIRLLAQLLNRLTIVKYRISSISGGSLRNAIPREAEVTLHINPIDESRVKKIVDKFVEETLQEFNLNDPGLEVEFKAKNEDVTKVFSKKLTQKLIRALLAVPHGIMAMSPDIPGLVETSTNLATVDMHEDLIRVGTSQRSSIENAKKNISNQVVAVFELSGASKVKIGDGYPGWQPNMDSELLKVSQKVFKETFGKDPEIKAIHAGLETGILGTKFPGMDMISFGPTIENAHSPDERVNIDDVNKFYKLLKGILLEFTK